MATERWDIDASHSTVGFMIRHMMFAKVRGRFTKFSGALLLDEQNPGASSVEATMETASLTTADEKRDAHLRSADFFEADKFPQVTFKSKRIEAHGKGHYKVTGDLSMHGVTKEITLEVEEQGRGKDPWGGQRVGFAVHGHIPDRKEYGLKWNQALEAGGVLVGDKVEIEIEAEFVKKA